MKNKEKERIVKVVLYDTQTSRGFSFEHVKNIEPAILTAYGRVINEDDIYLTIACFYDKEAETIEGEHYSEISSFFLKALKSAIIELKELGTKRK